MSPEYVVVTNPKTLKSEIKVNLLDGEDRKSFSREIMIAHVATSYLKYDSDTYNAMETLLKILPPDISKNLLNALIKKVEGVSVKFKKTGEDKYSVIESNLPPVIIQNE